MPDEVTLDPAHADTGGVEAPKPEAAKPEPEIKVSDDGNVAEHNGVKYIRQEALHNERQARQAAQQRLKEIEERLAPVLPEFNEYLAAKQNRADRARHTQSSGPADEPEYLDEVALAMGFYNEQSQPDRARAQAHLSITRREAERAAKTAVEPLARTTTADRAAANREYARQMKFSDGKPIADMKYVNTALEALGDNVLADRTTADLALLVAMGMEVAEHRKNGTVPSYFTDRRGARREPMHTEGGGYRPGPNYELSSFDLAAARSRGKTPEQWAKLVASVNKTDELEDY